MGITSCLFILLYVQDELTYDTFYPKKDRLFRLTTRAKFRESEQHVAVAMWGVAPALQEQFPEVEKAVRVLPFNHPQAVKVRNTIAYEKNFLAADPAIFAVFSYPLLRGDANTALAGPHKIVLTQTLAHKYFAGDDPMGKSLLIGPDAYQVAGIMADLPTNTDLKFDALLSLADPQAESDDWVYTYLLLKRPGDVGQLTKKLVGFAQDSPLLSAAGENTTLGVTYYLDPITQVHFQRGLSWDTPKGNASYVYIFTLTGLLVLLIACINYVNLAVVQSLRRSTEVGIRKVFGAQRQQLIKQFMGESGLMVFLAMLIALAGVMLAMPAYNTLTGKNATIGALANGGVLLGIGGIFVLIGLITGLYPAFFLSAYQPINVLKAKVYAKTTIGVKEILVTIQFIIAVGVVMATLVVYQQLALVRTIDLGFTKNPILVLDVPPGEGATVMASRLQTEMARLSGVDEVALGDEGALPGSMTSMDIFVLDKGGRQTEKVFKDIYADERYLNMLGLTLAAGRNFVADHPVNCWSTKR